MVTTRTCALCVCCCDDGRRSYNYYVSCIFMATCLSRKGPVSHRRGASIKNLSSKPDGPHRVYSATRRSSNEIQSKKSSFLTQSSVIHDLLRSFLVTRTRALVLRFVKRKSCVFTFSGMSACMCICCVVTVVLQRL